MYTVDVVYSAGVEVGMTAAEEVDVGTPFPVSVSVTGQTVVYRAIVSVVTWVDRAGQFVTVAAQLVIV